MPRSLSPREAEILGLVAIGRTTKEIAARLGIAESTVDWHVANAFARLGASSRAEAVAIALREGLLGEQRVEPLTPVREPRRRSVPLRVRVWDAAALVVLVLVLGQAFVSDSVSRGTPRERTPSRPTATAVPAASPRPTAAPVSPAPGPGETPSSPSIVLPSATVSATTAPATRTAGPTPSPTPTASPVPIVSAVPLPSAPSTSPVVLPTLPPTPVPLPLLPPLPLPSVSTPPLP